MCWGVAHAGNHARILNVNADLGYFDNIIPCGIRGKAVTFITSRIRVEKSERGRSERKY
jgi:lipoyl(octanoyl) transferase